MRPVGRFAPSPTGVMHLGNLRTALLAWLQMRHLRGDFILRIEDLDKSRCRPAAEQRIQADLRWLGLEWDAFYRQSERLGIYADYLQRLHTYPCTCSRKDVQEALSAPHLKSRAYPGTCLSSPLQPERPRSLRWHTPDAMIAVQDAYQPPLCYALKSVVGDFVLQRNDGGYAYHFTVVVDDGLMGVTHVTRGADLWRSTPQQVALQRALGFGQPVYAHVPLMKSQGKRLAKRDNPQGLAALQAEGMGREAVLAYLIKSLGWRVPKRVSLEDLLFEIQRGTFQTPLFGLVV